MKRLGAYGSTLILSLSAACGDTTTVATGGAGGVDTSSSSTTSSNVSTSSSSSSAGGQGGDGGSPVLLPDLTVHVPTLQADLDFDIVDAQSDQCLVGKECLGGNGDRLVLRFSTRTDNIGPVDFVIGDPTQSPGFVFSPCHNHYHYYDYASYRLVDADDDVVVTGHKQGFAVIDIGQIDPNDPNTPPNPLYGGNNQGIQHGWYDEYSSGLQCQWIDITDVPPGDYILEVEVNPSQLFVESTYTNNVAAIPVTIPECPLGCDHLDGECTEGSCVSGQGCVALPLNDGAPCDDFEFCTVDETCLAGDCGNGVPKECAPPDGCFTGSCDEAANTCVLVPGNDGQPCDDGSVCTTGTTCAAGACENGTPDSEGLMCDDGASCTANTTCASGVCGGGTGPAVYLADDFSDNSNGWTLGPTWEIGPAVATTNADLGGDDPADDHTATADDGVAGVAIGGTAPATIHGFYYLESPAFDTAIAPGPVILGFYRWLNSDFEPWMVNTVEVYNGTQWVALWTSTATILDAPTGGGPGWNHHQFDVTAHKNANMRVRFGYEVGSVNGLYDIGSWNVDDVLVASAACP